MSGESVERYRERQKSERDLGNALLTRTTWVTAAKVGDEKFVTAETTLNAQELALIQAYADAEGVEPQVVIDRCIRLALLSRPRTGE